MGPPARLRRQARRLPPRCGEIGEKLVGHVLGDAVDETRAELGDLAADMRLDVVVQQRAARGVGERHFRAALGEAGDAALALARDGVADERRDVGEFDLAFEGRRHRPDLGLDDGGEAVVAGFFQRLAARDAGLEHFGVVEQRPNLRPVGGQGHVARHRHGHRRFLPPRTRVRRYADRPRDSEGCARSTGSFSHRATKIKTSWTISPDCRRSWTCRRVAISYKARREQPCARSEIFVWISRLSNSTRALCNARPDRPWNAAPIVELPRARMAARLFESRGRDRIAENGSADRERVENRTAGRRWHVSCEAG